jgi:hypothetical protein
MAMKPILPQLDCGERVTAKRYSSGIYAAPNRTWSKRTKGKCVKQMTSKDGTEPYRDRNQGHTLPFRSLVRAPFARYGTIRYVGQAIERERNLIGNKIKCQPCEMWRGSASVSVSVSDEGPKWSHSQPTNGVKQGRNE